MTSLKIQDLKIHPKNSYYFDDVSGEKWERFLESVKTNGVRVPITVTDDMTVVSGNQRVRACKELGISVINAEIEHYKDEDDVIRDLIEINIRQRGAIDDSEIKAGRRYSFLQYYYGVKHGGNRRNTDSGSSLNYSDLKTQEQIASECGVSVGTMYNYIKLAESIPEIQELVNTGIVTPTTACAIIKKLPESEQRNLAEKFAADGTKISLKKANEEIKKLKERPVEVIPPDYEDLKQQVSSLTARNKNLEEQNNKLNSSIINKDEEITRRDEEITHLRSKHSHIIREADAAYDFWVKVNSFTKTTLAPFHYDEIVTNNQDNSSGDYIIGACNLLIEAATDILKRFKTEIIDVR